MTSNYQARSKRLRKLIRKFDKKFPKEADCAERIYKFIPGGIKCQFCGSKDLDWEHGARVTKCGKCLKNVHLTAGTLFKGVRNCRPWLLGIWLLEQGEVFSASMFAKEVGIAPATALVLLKKIKLVILENMNNTVLIGSATLSEIICKRSKETPAREHPLAEQTVIDEYTRQKVAPGTIDGMVEAAMDALFQPTHNFKQNVYTVSSISILENTDNGKSKAPVKWENEKTTYRLLSNSPQSSDALCIHSGLSSAQISSALGMLEIAGFVERLPGDRFKPTTLAQTSIFIANNSNSMSVDIASIVNFIRDYYHGLSRKYLQIYLASYWCIIDRNRWRRGALLRACVRHSPISYSQVITFVTPHQVQVAC